MHYRLITPGAVRPRLTALACMQSWNSEASAKGRFMRCAAEGLAASNSSTRGYAFQRAWSGESAVFRGLHKHPDGKQA